MTGKFFNFFEFGQELRPETREEFNKVFSQFDELKKATVQALDSLDADHASHLTQAMIWGRLKQQAAFLEGLAEQYEANAEKMKAAFAEIEE